MKKTLMIVGFFFINLMTVIGQSESYNPYLIQGVMNPAPLLPAEFNGTGTITFDVGNTGSSDIVHVSGQEMLLTITLSYGVPDNGDPVAAVSGPGAAWFSWEYFSATRTYRATQIATIPGDSRETINIAYRVVENSFYGQSYKNGYNVNISPPGYTNPQPTDDDTVAAYTYVEAKDFGDAPSTYGEAQHMIDLTKDSDGFYNKYMYLGNRVDPDVSYQASTDATGDDSNQTGGLNVDDEDGVIFPALIPGSTVTIPVVLTIVDGDQTGYDGRLSAWIDWNGDGDFVDAGERIVTNMVVDYLVLGEASSGTVYLQVTVPSTATVGQTFARFRFGPSLLLATAPYRSAAYGEVEDYQITIDAPSGEVTGHLYLDINGNGSQNAGEPDLADIDVIVTDSANGIHTVTSDSSGVWSVTVPPGSTMVMVVESDSDLPVGCVRTEGANPRTVTVVNGASSDAGSYGYFIPVCIGNCVWLDDNGDGVRNAGEPGVSNVTVRLLNASAVLVAQTVTDANGDYLFTGQPPATYQLAFVPPAEYAFTIEGVEAVGLLHSDVTPVSGTSQLITVPVGDTNLTVNAGIYVPAYIFGYLFMDENDSLIRDQGDNVITNAAVTLYVNGAWVGTVNTDTNGYYSFADTPVGAVSVIVSRAYSVLVDIPVSGDAAADERRNRAVPGDEETAYINYAITSGYGVLEAEASEPLNFGFTLHPLSTAISLKAYSTSDGKVMIEIATVNENGQSAIEIYAWINGEWVAVAQVPAAQIVGFGNNAYTVEAFGLTPGESYRFRIVDEAGHIYESGLIEVALASVLIEAVTLAPEMIKVAFNTEYGNFYQVMVCGSLGAPWVVEYIQYPTAKGWSVLSNESFMAGPGERTEVLIPRNNRPQAFFKVMKIQ